MLVEILGFPFLSSCLRSVGDQGLSLSSGCVHYLQEPSRRQELRASCMDPVDAGTKTRRSKVWWCTCAKEGERGSICRLRSGSYPLLKGVIRALTKTAGHIFKLWLELAKNLVSTELPALRGDWLMGSLRLLQPALWKSVALDPRPASPIRAWRVINSCCVTLGVD